MITLILLYICWLFSVLLLAQKRAGESQHSYDICMLQAWLKCLTLLAIEIGLQVVIVLQILFLCIKQWMYYECEIFVLINIKHEVLIQCFSSFICLKVLLSFFPKKIDVFLWFHTSSISGNVEVVNEQTFVTNIKIIFICDGYL